MQDHFHTALQALQHNLAHYCRRSSYAVTRHLNDVNALTGLNYDLFLLDRDCTLQAYHARERVFEFEHALRSISSKAELISNSSFNEFLRIRDIFADTLSLNKLVRMGEQDYLLRVQQGKLCAFEYPGFKDASTTVLQGDKLLEPINYNYKKPNPKVVEAVVDMNLEVGRVKAPARVLMVGDRYLTDIVAGNLAKVDGVTIDTAKVKPYKPLSDPLSLVLVRYLLDVPVGRLMS